MRGLSIVLSSVALCLLLGSFSATAQDAKDTPDAQSPRWHNPKRYNLLKLINRGPKSANEQLASNGDLEAKRTHQLQVQGAFPRDKNLQDVCSTFKYLDECVTALRISRNLQIDLTCLKWDLTGVKPKPVSDSCAGPADGKAMPLHRAIDLLIPDSDARGEARDALRRAQEDIKDARGQAQAPQETAPATNSVFRAPPKAGNFHRPISIGRPFPWQARIYGDSRAEVRWRRIAFGLRSKLVCGRSKYSLTRIYAMRHIRLRHDGNTPSAGRAAPFSNRRSVAGRTTACRGHGRGTWSPPTASVQTPAGSQ